MSMMFGTGSAQKRVDDALDDGAGGPGAERNQQVERKAGVRRRVQRPVGHVGDQLAVGGLLLVPLRSDRFEIVFPRRFAYLLKVLRCLPAPLAFAVTRRLVPEP